MPGGDVDTVSGSAAEHTPDMHEVAVFVLLTEAGGEITAVLVMAVCAKTAGAATNIAQANAADATARLIPITAVRKRQPAPVIT